jgi:hypothetical protein
VAQRWAIGADGLCVATATRRRDFLRALSIDLGGISFLRVCQRTSVSRGFEKLL